MDKTDKACPVSDFTSMLGGKWKLVIIGRLRNKEALRFGFLAASIDNISRKVYDFLLIKRPFELPSLTCLKHRVHMCKLSLNVV